MLEPARLDPGGKRHGEQLQEIKAQTAIDFVRVTAAHVCVTKTGITQPAGLHQVGFGDAELAVSRLQAAIVEERDLNSIFNR